VRAVTAAASPACDGAGDYALEPVRQARAVLLAVEAVEVLLNFLIAFEGLAPLVASMERSEQPAAGVGHWSGLVEARSRWFWQVEARARWFWQVEARRR
jgi:hypothetical protein